MENGWKMGDGKCTPHGPPQVYSKHYGVYRDLERGRRFCGELGWLGCDLECRWLPSAVNDRGWRIFRPVQPKHGDEFCLRCWQPVGFLGFAWRIRLQIQV